MSNDIIRNCLVASIFQDAALQIYSGDITIQWGANNPSLLCNNLSTSSELSSQPLQLFFPRGKFDTTLLESSSLFLLFLLVKFTISEN